MYFHSYYNTYCLPYLPQAWNYESTQPTAYQMINLTPEYHYQKTIQANQILQQIGPKQTPTQYSQLPGVYSVCLRDNPKVIDTNKAKSSSHHCQQNKELQQGVKSFPKRKYLHQQHQINKSKIKTNSISNILRLFLRRISTKSSHFVAILSKIIKKYRFDLEPHSFLKWLEQQQINHRVYLTTQSVKKYFQSSKCSQYNQIMRVLLQYFIKSQGVLCYLTSKKAKKESLIHNLMNLRQISKELFE